MEYTPAEINQLLRLIDEDRRQKLAAVRDFIQQVGLQS